jgi:Ribonuclease G/E
LHIAEPGGRQEKGELARDLQYLLKLHEGLKMRSWAQNPPSSTGVGPRNRTIRDYFSADIDEVLVDSRMSQAGPGVFKVMLIKNIVNCIRKTTDF